MDLISRQAAIDALMAILDKPNHAEFLYTDEICKVLNGLPSAQPTLYGYEINHLAYIAKIMEKEGVTAEYAVRTFGDISRAVRMTIEEAIEIASKECGEFRGIYERIKDGVDALPSAH